MGRDHSASRAHHRAEHRDLSGNPSIEHVRRLCGAEVADELCTRAGGRRVYVPRGRIAESALGQIIGERAVSKLAAAFGGESIDVPTMRHLVIQKLCLAGKSAGQVASEALCSRRTVFKVKAQLRAEGKLT